MLVLYCELVQGNCVAELFLLIYTLAAVCYPFDQHDSDVHVHVHLYVCLQVYLLQGGKNICVVITSSSHPFF